MSLCNEEPRGLTFQQKQSTDLWGKFPKRKEEFVSCQERFLSLCFLFNIFLLTVAYRSTFLLLHFGSLP
jgi:hypothetical protein